MDTPKKTVLSTKGKAKKLPLGNGKHTTNPTEQSAGYGKGASGNPSLNGAHGSKGKF